MKFLKTIFFVFSLCAIESYASQKKPSAFLTEVSPSASDHKQNGEALSLTTANKFPVARSLVRKKFLCAPFVVMTKGTPQYKTIDEMYRMQSAVHKPIVQAPNPMVDEKHRAELRKPYIPSADMPDMEQQGETRPKSPDYQELTKLALRSRQGYVYNRDENKVDREDRGKAIIASMNKDLKIKAHSLLWSNSGSRFVVQSAEHCLYVWEIAFNKVKGLLDTPSYLTDIGLHRNSVLSPDGTKLALMGFKPARAESAAAEPLEGFMVAIYHLDEQRWLYAKKGNHMSWSNSSKYCLIPDAFGLEVFDAQTGNTLWKSHQVINEGGFMWSADDRFIYTYDNKFFKAGNEPSEVHVYDATDGNLVATKKGKPGCKIKNMDVTPEGTSFCFMSSTDEYTIDFDGAKLLMD